MFITFVFMFFLVCMIFLTVDHEYDALVIGAGGAGLRAAMGCAEAGEYIILSLKLLRLYFIHFRY